VSGALVGYIRTVSCVNLQVMGQIRDIMLSEKKDKNSEWAWN